MGQKDLAAKDLESKPEVFADIINAFIFSGDQVVSAENLKPAPTETVYESTYEILRNQYNDVSKYEMAGHEIGIQYVLENESKRNSRLILRKAGYEGAIYRSEYEDKHVYPVVVLVLYWGKRKWKTYSDLFGFFEGAQIAPPVKNYMDNIKLCVFSMAHLPKKIRQRFKSDMRIIVDYLAEGADYEPTTHKIKYIEPVMRLLYALTGEKEFLNSIAELAMKQEKGGVTMCEVVDKFVARGMKQGIEQGIQQGIEQGIQQGIEQVINALIETSIEFGSTKGETIERIIKKLKISNDAAELYVSKYW